MNKIVVVTGGGSGIGREISRAFAKIGAKIVIADVNATAANENIQYIRQELKSECMYVATDVSKEADVKNLVAKTVDTYGALHVLINNAGIFHNQSDLFADNAVSEFDRVIGINLRGPFMCAKYCAEAMKKTLEAQHHKHTNVSQASNESEPKKTTAIEEQQKQERMGECVIINIASTRAFMSEKNTFGYSASKGGILALTHSLAISLAPFSIRVNTISPGWIDVANEPLKTSDHEQHPARRVGIPQDIARACVFLADPQSSFITGANLTIDGGMTVKMIYNED